MPRIRTRIVNRVTERAIKVTLAKHPYRLIYLPKSQVKGGDRIEAGAEGLTIEVTDWIWNQKLAEMRAAADQ